MSVASEGTTLHEMDIFAWKPLAMREQGDVRAWRCLQRSEKHLRTIARKRIVR